ncbi:MULTISPECIES: RsiV family protein [unclassified Psychrobacter]|uniref:RsiV family protein n=1 Tax=unclassified Psychrobacter TaxID=196806 RepID=UPI0025FCC8F8|nr:MULTISPECIES: RsiV family protein [unclassified Psychrobacter]
MKSALKPCLTSMLSGGVLLGALSLSAHAGSLINHTEYLDYKLPKKIEEKCAARDNCPDIEVKYLNSNQAWINTLTNARINNLVVNSKPTESAPITKKNSPAAVRAAIDDFVNSQFTDLPADSVFVYSLTVTPEYLGHVNDFELFEINSYVFTGGAHGMPYSEYLIFDQQSKKQIQLTDMLQPNKKSRFKALAYNAYKEWVKTVDDDVTSYEKNWPFTLSDNVTLTDKGVDIRYQHYSIGPYAYGMPVLNVPYDKLSGIIKPRFIPK